MAGRGVLCWFSGVVLVCGSATLAPLSGSGWMAAGRTATAPAPVTSPVRYEMPLDAPLRVVRSFERPPTRYAAGHRGVDLATSGAIVVLAAGPGRVRFAGWVVSRGVIVILHPDGITTEYEPVVPVVSVGTQVRTGQPIGRVGGTHGTCPPNGCLHWAARRAGAYFDPLTLLGGLEPIRLLPWPDP